MWTSCNNHCPTPPNPPTEEQNLLRATTFHFSLCSEDGLSFRELFFFATIINQSRPYDSFVFLRSCSAKAKWCFVH